LSFGTFNFDCLDSSFGLMPLFVFGAQSCASKKNTSIINGISIQKKSNDKVIEKNLLYIIDGKVVLSDFV
jgi:hypothetical protein